MENQVMTVLEAHVPTDKWQELMQTFRAASSPERLPEQMLSTMLVQSRSDPDLWQGISVWRSAEALKDYRASVSVPEGIQMFRSVGVEPGISIFEVQHLARRA
jgi:quinol monooxygenase YgiN